MAKITTSKGTRRILGYYTATVMTKRGSDNYWMRVQEARSKVNSRFIIEYWIEVRWMSETKPDVAIQTWAQLHSNGTQPIALEEIVAKMSTGQALREMPYPLWCDGIKWRQVDSPPWDWV